MSDYTEMDVTKPSSSDSMEEVLQEPVTQEPKVDEKPFKCMECGRSFKEKHNLNQHMKIHSGVKPFACIECNRMFFRKSALERHKKTHTKQVIRFKCEQCLEDFSHKLELEQHKKKSHPKLRIHHKCMQCSEDFKLKMDLSLHIRKVHPKPPIRYKCVQCPEDFRMKTELSQHIRKVHPKPPIRYKCVQCPEDFRMKTELSQHIRKVHPKPPKIYSCKKCTEEFHHKSDFYKHIRSHSYVPKTPSENIFAEKVKHLERKNALNVFSTTTFYPDEENNKDLLTFFNSVRSDMNNELNFQLFEKRNMKWYATIKVILLRKTEDGFETIDPYFRSKSILQLTSDNISSHIDEAFAKITNSFEKFIERGSGWTLDSILYLELSTAKYRPFG